MRLKTMGLFIETFVRTLIGMAFDLVINSIVRSIDRRQMNKLGLNEAEWNLPWRERRKIILLRARQKRKNTKCIAQEVNSKVDV
jgi:hypothetical protein